MIYALNCSTVAKPELVESKATRTHGQAKVNEIT